MTITNSKTVFAVKMSDESLALLRGELNDYRIGLQKNAQAQEKGRAESLNVVKDMSGLFYETGRKVVDAAINIVPDALNLVLFPDFSTHTKDEPSFGRAKVGEMYDELSSQIDPNYAGNPIPRIETSAVKYDFRSEMMRRDINGKLDGNGTKAGDAITTTASVVAPIVVGGVIKSKVTPQSLNLQKPLTAIEAQAETQAASLIEQAQRGEPQITATLSKTAKETGGEMAGLENRTKSQESLSRKIADRTQEKVNYLKDKKGKSFEEAIKYGLEKELPKQMGKINDVLRYTTTFSENQYQSGIQKTLSALEKQGYKIEKVYDGWSLRNAGGGKDIGYRGINVTMRSPKGQQFELQFHTKSSFELKTKNHTLYEEWRNSKVTEARKKEIVNIQIKEAEKIPLPRNIDDIPKILEEFVKRGENRK